MRVRSEFREVLNLVKQQFWFLILFFTFSLWGICFNWRCSIWHIFSDM